MKMYCQRSLFRIIVSLALVTFYLPACLSKAGNCSLLHGKAVPLDSTTGYGETNMYTFTCDDGYVLDGVRRGLCLEFTKPHCRYGKCFSKPPCSGRDASQVGSVRHCKCKDGYNHVYWMCSSLGWYKISGYCACNELSEPSYGYIQYTSSAVHSAYPYGTQAIYRCNSGGELGRRECTYQGWSGSELAGCGSICSPLAELANGHITYAADYHPDFGYFAGTKATCVCDAGYQCKVPTRTCTSRGWSGGPFQCSSICSPLAELANGHITYAADYHPDFGYFAGTKATCVCDAGYQCKVPTRTCTSRGWSGGPFQCKSRPSEHHHEDKKTLIIVSGTTGAILGALIILVVIVSCQRRLHYHRLRRARLRCRQDQDAFAAFIAYSRDVRFMLPSYDEAMNQRGQGQPPTFDEAIADNGQYSPAGTPPSAENSPSSTASHPTHPAVSQCSSTPTSTPTESETVEVDDSVNLQVTPSRGANGRFLRALRVLFGGWTFASRAMYCQLVPQVNFEGANANEGPETEQPSLTDSRRELDETLVRAGLC